MAEREDSSEERVLCATMAFWVDVLARGTRAQRRVAAEALAAWAGFLDGLPEQLVPYAADEDILVRAPIRKALSAGWYDGRVPPEPASSGGILHLDGWRRIRAIADKDPTGADVMWLAQAIADADPEVRYP